MPRDDEAAVAPLGSRGVGMRCPVRPGVLGSALLLPTWVLLGLALVLYVVGVLALAFAAVLLATLRLVLGPPLRLLARLPGVRAVVERYRLHRYAQRGLTVLEQQLRRSPRRVV